MASSTTIKRILKPQGFSVHSDDQQRALHQRILSLYDLIEQKTMSNLLMKKQNDDIQLQIRTINQIRQRYWKTCGNSGNRISQPQSVETNFHETKDYQRKTVERHRQSNRNFGNPKSQQPQYPQPNNFDYDHDQVEEGSYCNPNFTENQNQNYADNSNRFPVKMIVVRSEEYQPDFSPKNHTFLQDRDSQELEVAQQNLNSNYWNSRSELGLKSNIKPIQEILSPRYGKLESGLQLRPKREYCYQESSQETGFLTSKTKGKTASSKRGTFLSPRSQLAMSIQQIWNNA